MHFRHVIRFSVRHPCFRSSTRRFLPIATRQLRPSRNRRTSPPAIRSLGLVTVRGHTNEISPSSPHRRRGSAACGSSRGAGECLLVDDESRVLARVNDRRPVEASLSSLPLPLPPPHCPSR